MKESLKLFIYAIILFLDTLSAVGTCLSSNIFGFKTIILVVSLSTLKIYNFASLTLLVLPLILFNGVTNVFTFFSNGPLNVLLKFWFTQSLKRFINVFFVDIGNFFKFSSIDLFLLLYPILERYSFFGVRNCE